MKILFNLCSRKLSISVSSVPDNSVVDINFHWYSWFKMIMFYQYGLVYTCVRMTYNISQAMIVFYLLYTVRITETSVKDHTPLEVAIIPLVIYIFSCLGSFSCEKFFHKFGRFILLYSFFILIRNNTFVIGTILIIISSIFLSVKIIINFINYFKSLLHMKPFI